MAQSVLYIGIAGTVVALDRVTGQEVWRQQLKGGDFVNVVLDGGDLYATTKGEIFSLDPGTGTVRWQNPLKGLGRGLVAIAAADSRIAVLREKQRRDEAAAAAAAAG